MKTHVLAASLLDGEKQDFSGHSLFVSGDFLESRVTGLERWRSAQRSEMFEKIDEQLGKGYFPLWIVQNFLHVYQPPLDYWEKFMNSDKKKVLL